jgi:glycosyltransferase involved in cell wall biosynthesis
MRVLYLNPCGQMGGAETSLLELLRGVRDAQPEWELWLVLGEDGPLTGKARELGIEVQVVPFPPALARTGDVAFSPLVALRLASTTAFATARYTRRLGAVIRSIRPDVIHTNGFKMHVMGAWAASRGTPVIWHIHDYVRSRRWMGRILRQFRGRCAAAIVNSRSVAADVQGLLPAVNITVIYNAVDLTRFAPEGPRADLDGLSGLPAGAPGLVRVGLVATFARWKGHRVFLQALAQLPADAPIRGYVIGGPIYQTSGSQWTRAELEQEADRLGLSGRIGFTGVIEDAARAMRGLDIVVHASTEPEPFGMVIAEGMACAKPVIVSQAGGAAELFTNGENALAHNPGDVTALSRQILRLAGDPAMRARLSSAGRQSAERRYSRERLAKELIAVYSGFLPALATLPSSAGHRSPVAATPFSSPESH